MNAIVMDIYWTVGIIVGAGGIITGVAGFWMKALIRGELDVFYQRLNGTYVRRKEADLSNKATDYRLDEHDRRITRLETIQ